MTDRPEPAPGPATDRDLTDPTPATGTTEHDQKAARAAETLASLCFLASTAAAIGLGIVYWQGGQNQLEGLFLAICFGGIGVGVIVWAQRFMPDEEVTEKREPLTSTEEEIDALTEDLAQGEQSVAGRRRLLGSLAAALTALGAALLFPIRSLGPRPGRGLKQTPYSRAKGQAGGVRLVRRGATQDEPEYLRPDDLAVDGVLTVWPDGHLNEADSPTLVIRTRSTQTLRLAEGREDWVVDGIIAYSKLCTHVGCPVGLYQAGEGKLLCPCHQSTFNVLEGAKPIFGPAARALPQLPLGVDEDGYLIATGDFSSPVGPGFWDRGR